MTWKEKIRICIDVLFKGRDIKEELNAVERERIEVGERMREQLELLINDEKLNMVSNPNASMIDTIQIAEIEAAPKPYLRGKIPEQSPVIYQNFRLEIVDGKYRIQDHPHYIARQMDYTYEKVAHDFARELIRRKLVRVETLANPEDYYEKTLRFSVNVYKGYQH